MGKRLIGRQSTIRTCRSYSYNAANTYTFGFDLFNLDRYAEYFSQEAAAAASWKTTLKAVGTGLGAGVKAVQAAVKAATGEESTSLLAGVSNLTVNWIDQDTINFGVGKTLNLKPVLSTCAINKVTLAGGMDRASRWRYGLATIAGFIPLATEFARTICRVNEAVAAADTADPSRISEDLDRYQRSKAVLDAACEISPPAPAAGSAPRCARPGPWRSSPAWARAGPGNSGGPPPSARTAGSAATWTWSPGPGAASCTPWAPRTAGGSAPTRGCCA